MRIGIISDIHGNYEALKSVLGELREMGIEEIYANFNKGKLCLNGRN